MYEMETFQSSFVVRKSTVQNALFEIKSYSSTHHFYLCFYVFEKNIITNFVDFCEVNIYCELKIITVKSIN